MPTKLSQRRQEKALKSALGKIESGGTFTRRENKAFASWKKPDTDEVTDVTSNPTAKPFDPHEYVPPSKEYLSSIYDAEEMGRFPNTPLGYMDAATNTRQTRENQQAVDNATSSGGGAIKNSGTGNTFRAALNDRGSGYTPLDDTYMSAANIEGMTPSFTDPGTGERYKVGDLSMRDEREAADAVAAADAANVPEIAPETQDVYYNDDSDGPTLYHGPGSYQGGGVESESTDDTDLSTTVTTDPTTVTTDPTTVTTDDTDLSTTELSKKEQRKAERAKRKEGKGKGGGKSGGGIAKTKEVTSTKSSNVSAGSGGAGSTTGYSTRGLGNQNWQLS